MVKIISADLLTLLWSEKERLLTTFVHIMPTFILNLGANITYRRKLIELLQTIRNSAGIKKLGFLEKKVLSLIKPMIVSTELEVEYPKFLSSDLKSRQAVMAWKWVMSAVIRTAGRTLQRMKMQTMASRVYTRCCRGQVGEGYFIGWDSPDDGHGGSYEMVCLFHHFWSDITASH